MKRLAVALPAAVLMLSGCAAFDVYYRAESALAVVDAVEKVVLDQYAGMTKSQVCLPPGPERDRAVRAVVVMGWTLESAKPTDECARFFKENK